LFPDEWPTTDRVVRCGHQSPGGGAAVLAARAKDARIIDSPHGVEPIHPMNHMRRIDMLM
jgi:hypothetical protein